MRPRRKIEFERVMLRQAWTAEELAPKLNIGVVNCRRYLRRYYDYGLLDREKDGRFYFYAIARFLKPPDKYTDCQQCDGPVAVYKRRCGCVFYICEEDEADSRFEYCKRHSANVSHSRAVREKHETRGGEPTK